MENFEKITEYCLSGKLSGTFVLRDGNVLHSSKLKKIIQSLLL